MGAAHPHVSRHIEEEFRKARCGAETDEEASEGEESRVGLCELLEMKQVTGFPVNFTHMGVLYVVDKKKTGVFGEQDLQAFAEWCAENISDCEDKEFTEQVQCRCVLEMWRGYKERGSGGAEFLANWLVEVVRQAEGGKVPQMPYSPSADSMDDMSMSDVLTTAENEASCLSRSQIEVLYQVLNIRDCHGMDFQSFFNLLYMCCTCNTDASPDAASPTNSSAYVAPNISRGIPLTIVSPFLQQFVSSYFKLLTNLGLSPLTTYRP